MFKFSKKNKKIKKKNDSRGITLVISITVMTLLLSISLSVSNIVLRQIRITNVNNSSKLAFFTADSAIECAFYHDTLQILDEEGQNINEVFETSIFGQSDLEFTTDYVKCGNSGLLNLVKDATTNPAIVTTNFDIDYGEMCAKVEIVRSEVSTKITSRGYNTDSNEEGCNLEDINTRRLVERGLTITY